jgi:hypothetical protein
VLTLVHANKTSRVSREKGVPIPPNWLNAYGAGGNSMTNRTPVENIGVSLRFEKAMSGSEKIGVSIPCSEAVTVRPFCDC